MAFLGFAFLGYEAVYKPQQLSAQLDNAISDYTDAITEIYDDIYTVTLSTTTDPNRTERLQTNVLEADEIIDEIDDIKSQTGYFSQSTGDLAQQVLDFHDSGSGTLIIDTSEYIATFQPYEREFTELNIDYPAAQPIYGSNSDIATAAKVDYENYKAALNNAVFTSDTNIQKRDLIINITDQLLVNLEERAENRAKVGEVTQQITEKYPQVKSNNTTHPRYSDELTAWTQERTSSTKELVARYKQLVEEGDSIIDSYNETSQTVSHAEIITSFTEYSNFISNINTETDSSISKPELIEPISYRYSNLSDQGKIKKDEEINMALQDGKYVIVIDLYQETNSNGQSINDIESKLEVNSEPIVEEKEDGTSREYFTVSGTYVVQRTIGDLRFGSLSIAYTPEGTVEFRDGKVYLTVTAKRDEKLISTTDYVLSPVFEELD